MLKHFPKGYCNMSDLQQASSEDETWKKIN